MGKKDGNKKKQRTEEPASAAYDIEADEELQAELEAVAAMRAEKARAGGDDDISKSTARVPWRIAASKHLHDRDTGKHTPQKAGNTGYSKKDHRRIDSRGRCVVCDDKTTFQCQECETMLCIGIPGGKCCWSTFHGQNDFRKSKRSLRH